MGRVLVTDLIMENGVGGVEAFSQSSGEWITISGRAIILATGGASALYSRNDNPNRMLGDGYRLGLEAGAVLQGMEFVQFYPLCLSGPGVPPLVIPPKLADHGRLVNDHGEDILEKYSIHERPAGERARDLLSQALFREIARNERTVWLDLRDVSEQEWCDDPFSASVERILGNLYGAKRPAGTSGSCRSPYHGRREDQRGLCEFGSGTLRCRRRSREGFMEQIVWAGTP